MSKKKLFDFCIGNPPYNTDFNDSGENKKFAAPVYNILWMLLIRFLRKLS